MSKRMSAMVYGQKKVKKEVVKHCRICGRPIYYGVNGAMMLDTCLECYKPTYHCSPTPARQSADWDELNAMEDRCIRDDEI